MNVSTSVIPQIGVRNADPTLSPNEQKKQAMTANAAKLASIRAAAPATPSLGTTITPADPETIGLGNAAEPLSVDGLLAAWGQRDSSYDLDGDGTVNMADLIAMLSRLAAGSTPPSEEGEGPAPSATGIAGVLSDAPPSAAPPEPMSVDGLMEVWGQKSTQYDLDGDGTVNMNDLIALLSRLDGASAPNEIGQVDPAASIVASEPNASDTANTPPPPSDAVATPATPYTVDGLLEAWGQENSQYDLNGDGTVNMADLLTLLSRLGGSDHKGGPGRDALVARPGLETRSSLAESTGDRIRGLATALTNRLKDSGFEEHPPSNLHDLVGRIKLTGDERKALMGQLQSQYPHGLGVNLRV